MDVIFVMGIVQYAVELDFLDFGNGADVAWHQLIDFDVLLAEEVVQMVDLESALGVADKKLGIFLDRSLMDAEYAKFTDEGVADDFEDVCQDMFAGVGNDLERGGVLVVGTPFVEGLRVAFVGRWCQGGQRIEQLRDAGAGFAGNEENRNQMSFAQCFSERRVQSFRRRVGAIFQVLGE